MSDSRDKEVRTEWFAVPEGNLRIAIHYTLGSHRQMGTLKGQLGEVQLPNTCREVRQVPRSHLNGKNMIWTISNYLVIKHPAEIIS